MWRTRTSFRLARRRICHFLSTKRDEVTWQLLSVLSANCRQVPLPFFSICWFCTASELRVPWVNLPHRWVRQHVPSCILRRICYALVTCAQGLAGPTPERERKNKGFFSCRSLVSVGLLVTFARNSGLNNRGDVSRVTPTPTYTHKKTRYREPRHEHPNTRINTEAIAHENTKTKKKTKTGHDKYKKYKKYNNKCNKPYEYKFNKDARNQNTPENTIAGRRLGCVLCAGFFVQKQQGRNCKTRRCSGVPNGPECSHVTHFRGVPKKRLIPIPATQNRVHHNVFCPHLFASFYFKKYDLRRRTTVFVKSVR